MRNIVVCLVISAIGLRWRALRFVLSFNTLITNDYLPQPADFHFFKSWVCFGSYSILTAKKNERYGAWITGYCAEVAKFFFFFLLGRKTSSKIVIGFHFSLFTNFWLINENWNALPPGCMYTLQLQRIFGNKANDQSRKKYSPKFYVKSNKFLVKTLFFCTENWQKKAAQS